MAQKPSIAKGTRDFLPEELNRRNYITAILEENFKKFGFQEIQTPSFEKNQTLLGKYGDEGDRLIFKILNNGDYLKKVDSSLLNDKDSTNLTRKITGKSLRYDLTVPFARFVVQNQNELTFPFKRFQIQPVWRADRPQKGRFREFYQCDADVVGSESLWQEVEFIQLYDQVFHDLNLKGCSIKVNNRKLLTGLAEIMDEEDKFTAFTVALDKMDKVGEEGVKNEMIKSGISEKSIEKISPIFNPQPTFQKRIEQIKNLLSSSEVGMKGIQELEFIGKAIDEIPLKSAKIDLDLTLARGLDYYTGAIFEVVPPESADFNSSIGGGGRYDDLTGIFGLKNLSGIGISFGLDRIYLVLEKLGLFPATTQKSTQVIFINFGEKEALYAMKALGKLRENSIKAELYPDSSKMKKQMDYVNKREIPFVILAGTQEMTREVFTLKNMKSGEQREVDFEGLVNNIGN